MSGLGGITLLFLLALSIDVPWLLFRKQYHDALFYSIQKSKLTLNYLAGFLVYVVLALALFYGALREARDWVQAGVRGAIIGFVLYLFYDLTNMATLSNYTWEMVVTDSLWGMIQGFLTSAIGFSILSA
jgi:uncharacterized membrane protein